MTSYDVESDGPNFAPEHGVQLHDPRLLEYVGAPESARLTSCSPEYWVHHMGREKALSAALQLQHDAGLILSNVQVLQQLVTSLNRTSSDVMLAVHGRQPFPSSAIQQVMPSYRVRRGGTTWWQWVCGAHQSIRGYKCPCRQPRAMPARPARIASRKCLCEPGGEVNYITSDWNWTMLLHSMWFAVLNMLWCTWGMFR